MKISKENDLPKMIHNPKGEDIQELLGLVAGKISSHSLAKITIPPGNASLPHYHKHSEESYLILSGKARLIVDNQTFTLNEGETVLIEPGEVHQISNPVSEALIFIAVCVPAWSPDDSFDVNENGS